MTEPRSDLWMSPGPGPERRPIQTLGPAPATVAPAGATTPGPPARRARPWWLWAVVALVALVALLLGLTRCGADPEAADAPTTAPAPAATAPIPGAGVGQPEPVSPAGSLTAGATSLFEAARFGDRALVALVGQTAQGKAVPVQSVPADEGFWIGPSEADRVWVQLAANDESPVTITEGQLLDLSGAVVTHGADFAGKAGVAAAEGADQLTRQGAHLEVDPDQVTVVGTR